MAATKTQSPSRCSTFGQDFAALTSSLCSLQRTSTDENGEKAEHHCSDSTYTWSIWKKKNFFSTTSFNSEAIVRLVRISGPFKCICVALHIWHYVKSIFVPLCQLYYFNLQKKKKGSKPVQLVYYIQPKISQIKQITRCKSKIQLVTLF